jgi:hypothetical protein
MTAQVTLNEQQMDWCVKHARHTHQYSQKNIRNWAYKGSRVNGHLVGIKSELAVAIFFNQNNIEVTNHFKILDDGTITTKHDNVDKGDLIVNGYNIEVKGVNEKNWHKYKRQIPPIQLKKYASKDAIIVWTTVENHKIPRNKIILRGWNYAHEVISKGVLIKTICDNVKIYNDEDMNSMWKLLQIIKVIK